MSGNGQLICSLCPTESFSFDPLVVLVKDARGNPVPSATVTWKASTPASGTAALGSATTVTGSDGTASNTLVLSAPIQLLQPYLQTMITASALGSSATFTETNGTTGSGTGVALVQLNLLSPPSGASLTGAPGGLSPVPVRVFVGTLTPSGPVSGVEVHLVSDTSMPATAICAAGPNNPPNSVLTDAKGNATCNVQFGNTPGNGRIKVYVGDKYGVFGPINIQVTQPTPPPPAAAQLTANPTSLNFQSQGPLTQTITVTSSGDPVTYTTAVQTTIAATPWLTVGVSSGAASSTGSTFQVSVAPQSLQAGTYGGLIAIHPSNGTADIQIPVQLTVQSGGTPPPAGQLSVSPASLAFQYPGSGPFTRTVSVSSSSGSVSYTTQVSSGSSSVTWLSAGSPTGPASGIAPSTFQVTVTPQNLPAGTYSANVTVHPVSGGADIQVPVQVVVQSGGTPAAPQLTVNPQLLTFVYPGSGPLTQTVGVSGTSGSTSYTAQVQSMTPNGNWLALGNPTGPASANAQSTFTVSVIPQSLAPGTYQAIIDLHPQNGGADVTVPVQLTVQQTSTPATITVFPTSLSVNQMSGAGPVSVGTVSVSSSGSVMQFTATPTANWLSITPASGPTPSPLAISVNGGGLQPGSYSGTIQVTAPGAANGPQFVTINLTVLPSQRLSLSANSLTFTSQAGAAPPPPQSVTAITSTGSLPFTATVAVTGPQGGSWLSVTPQSGTAGGTASNLVVSVNPNGLTPGTYTGTVTVSSANAVNSPQTVIVTYTIAAAPSPSITMVTNGGSNTPGPVAPGEIVSIYGSNLGPPTGVATTITGGSVQSAIAGVQVSFDGIAAPLLFVSARQINAVVPYGLNGRVSTHLTVTYNNSSAAPYSLDVSPTAPGIFLVDSSGQGAILNTDGTMNGPANAAAAGSVIVIYATGEGATLPAGTDGLIVPTDPMQLKKPILPVTVTIGGYPAQVQYVGSAPSLVSGMLQVNAVVPDTVAAGNAVPVVLTMGGADSPAANVAIQ